MKVKLIFLTVLIVIFLGFVTVRQLIQNAANKSGELKVLSSPNSAIFVDNVATGKTPYTAKLKVGEYMIKLVPEGEHKDVTTWEEKVVVRENSLTYVNRELGSSNNSSAGEILTIDRQEERGEDGTGAIAVETEPQGAIVYLDNEEKGVASILMQNVPSGQHELSVFMPGFFRRTVKVKVIEGYRVEANFKLAIDESQQQNNPDAKAPEATKSAEINSADKEVRVEILETPTGFLRVRAKPTTGSEELAQIEPGEQFILLGEENDWYQIQGSDGLEGWVSAQYARKLTEN